MSPIAATTAVRRGRRALVTRLFAVGLVIAAAVATTPSVAQPADEGSVLERRVKAAFVFKFAAFVEWPPTALPADDAPIWIAVMGGEAMVQDLLEASGSSRTVEGRRVLAKQVAPGETLDGVHILFVRSEALGQLGGSVADLKPDAMLIVTESQGALSHGSVVNFVLEEGKVRFDISLGAAERRGLRLSSRLITVARAVIK
jgi:hypothetical protein